MKPASPSPISFTSLYIFLLLATFLHLQRFPSSALPFEMTFINLRQETSPLWQGWLSSAQSSFQSFWQLLPSDEPWRFVAPAFLHFHFMHLLLNLFWLLLLGPSTEKIEGSLLWFFATLTAAAGSNLVQYFFEGPLFIGLSGVNAFLIGSSLIYSFSPAKALLLRVPRSSLLFFALSLFVLALIDLALYLMRSLLMIPPLQIAHFAHLSGLLLGLLWGTLFTSIKRSLTKNLGGTT